MKRLRNGPVSARPPVWHDGATARKSGLGFGPRQVYAGGGVPGPLSGNRVRTRHSVCGSCAGDGWTCHANGPHNGQPVPWVVVGGGPLPLALRIRSVAPIYRGTAQPGELVATAGRGGNV